MRHIVNIIMFVMILLLAPYSYAGTYWVSSSGAASWSNCSGATPLSETAACSLSTANANATAGDTIYLRGGIYIINGNGIAPTHSGTSGNVITFSAYTGEAPIIYGKDYVSVADMGGASSVGINLRGSYTGGDWTGREYIKISGITFANVYYGFLIDHGGYNEISYCTFTFRDVWADVIKSGTAKNDASHYYQSAYVLYDTANDLSRYTNRRIYNVNGKSTMYMPDQVTTTTITARTDQQKLMGGTRQYWSNGDRYQITGNYPYAPAACDIGGASTHNYIHHNEIHGLGGFLYGQDGGVLFAIGRDGGDTDLNNNNTVEYNHIYHGGHHVFSVNAGKNNVVRHNYFHNEAWFDDSDYGGDCAAKGNCGYRVVSCGVDNASYGGHGLWEDNAIAYGDAFGGTHLLTGSSGAGMKLATPNNIYRYNDHFGNATAGLWFGSSVSSTAGNNKVYNNTFYHNGYRVGIDQYVEDEYRSGIFFYASGYSGNVVKNNLLYDHWAQNNKVKGSYWPAIVLGNGSVQYTANKANNTITNNYVNSSSSYYYSLSALAEMPDPMFVDPTITTPLGDSVWKTFGYGAYKLLQPDLSLQPGAQAIDIGTYLTQANGAGSSSIKLVVGDASYFQDGTWGSDLARGSAGNFDADWIAIGTVDNVVQIQSIDYLTKTITLAFPMSWANGVPVWLYKKSDGTQVLYGSAPDMGAHEYIAEALSISFSPTSISFSGVFTGTFSSPQTIQLNNTSAASVTINAISLSGTNADQFSIPAATDYCTGDTVAASGNCSFQVIFAPTSEGEKTASVNLTALYYGSSATLPLYGSATTRTKTIRISKISKK